MISSGGNLKNLFNPQSIAVIGASHHPEKIGYKILKNIVKGGFKDRIYPINPKGGKILLTVGALVKNFPEIIEIEINPLALLSQGKEAIALDAKINLCDQFVLPVIHLHPPTGGLKFSDRLE